MPPVSKRYQHSEGFEVLLTFRRVGERHTKHVGVMLSGWHCEPLNGASIKAKERPHPRRTGVRGDVYTHAASKVSGDMHGTHESTVLACQESGDPVRGTWMCSVQMQP